MPQLKESLIEGVEDRRLLKRVASNPQFAQLRAARFREIEAAIAKVETPEHGIRPSRGRHRPVVILNLTTVDPTVACLIEPSVTMAAAMIGVRDACSVCEAIRQRRPVRSYVVRYLDQMHPDGVEKDGLFYPKRLRGPFGPAERELLRQTVIARFVMDDPSQN